MGAFGKSESPRVTLNQLNTKLNDYERDREPGPLLRTMSRYLREAKYEFSAAKEFCRNIGAGILEENSPHVFLEGIERGEILPLQRVLMYEAGQFLTKEVQQATSLEDLYALLDEANDRVKASADAWMENHRRKEP